MCTLHRGPLLNWFLLFGGLQLVSAGGQKYIGDLSPQHFAGTYDTTECVWEDTAKGPVSENRTHSTLY